LIIARANPQLLTIPPIADAIVASQGIPQPFALALTGLDRWIREGCARGIEIPMADA
jgi:hypothetical protein